MFKTMYFTLHLTDRCNFRCDYCSAHCGDGRGVVMSKEVAFQVLERCGEYDSVGIVFFGGEPLLCKDLIEDIVEYSKKIDCTFHFKMTTNGLLLDDETLNFCLKNRIMIALSIDGVQQAHDLHRKDVAGRPTYERVEQVARRLLGVQPYTPAMMVLNPDTVAFFHDSVVHLFGLGFRYFVCTLNYEAVWDEKDMRVLKGEYQKLAKQYLEWTFAEEKFYFAPFEVKFHSHIMGEEYCRERCQLGKKQISVSPEGDLYPCIQFVNRQDFWMGNVETGIDPARQEALYRQNAEEKESCKDCGIRKRCNHHCGCINMATTGDVNLVSPIVCRHEQIVLPIADRVAEKLYKKRSGMFIQKQYNDMYPVISMIEGRSKGVKD